MTRETYGQAYQQGFRRTVRLLCARGASADHAEDVAQAAWMRGWERLHQLRDEGMIVSWVNAIAVNVHRYTIHREDRYQTLPDLCGQAGIDLAPIDLAHIALARIDAARILTLCRPRDRVLFEQQMGGLTTEEIATEQGVSATAIRIRFLRARRAARASVETRAADLRRSALKGNLA
jgi:RNA polymerase sigma factor (sigma-70 family)